MRGGAQAPRGSKGSKADRLLNQAASMSQNQLQSMAPSQPALPEE